MTRRTNASTGRGSPWELARIERNMIPFDALVPEAAGTALANIAEIGMELHHLAERLDAGAAVDTAALAAELRMLSCWLLTEAEGVTDGRR